MGRPLSVNGVLRNLHLMPRCPPAQPTVSRFRGVALCDSSAPFCPPRVIASGGYFLVGGL